MFTYKYPHPAVACDCCVFAVVDSKLSILLIRRGLEPFIGDWALPGGFMHIDESAEECAQRELREETGYRTERLKQFKVYSRPDRDPRERVLSIAFYALVKHGAVEGNDDAAEARWFDVQQLPQLAFDHAVIVADALKELRHDIYFEPIAFELLPDQFSMSELQRLYETIMQTQFDRRNFYNKMRHTGIVSEAGDDDDYDGAMMECKVNASSVMCEASHECEMPREYGSKASRSRRSGVKYSFNPIKYFARKNDKDDSPLTF